MRIIIPNLPPRDANPNTKIHYMRKADTARNMKQIMIATVLELSTMDRPKKPMKKAHITITFRAVDKRRRDFDNLFSACKAYIDGLVASDILVDDSVKHVSYSLYYESTADHDRTIFDIEESK